MKKLLIDVALAVLCVFIGTFIYSKCFKGNQKEENTNKVQTQIDPVQEELLNEFNEDSDISDMLLRVDDSDEFQTVREDWLKSMSGVDDIDDALKRVKEIDFRKITPKDVEKAIQCGDLETLKKIRRSGFSKWDNRKFVLIAANTPFADVMRFLAANGADLDVTDDEGISVIYLAAEGGNVETAKFLAGWIGYLDGVPVSKFPYLKDAVKALSLAAVRNMIDVAIVRKKEAGEDLCSEKTRRTLFLELSKCITMERKTPLPEGYAEFKKTALAEAEKEVDFIKEQSEITAAAEARFPLYKLLDRVKIGRQASSDSGIIYISGRLEKITPRYIIISQQYISTADIPEQEQSKFIPELNSRYRKKYIFDMMQESEKKLTRYLQKRWKKHLRTARMNGYFYDKGWKNFIHASDVFDEELHKSLGTTEDDEIRESGIRGETSGK